MLCKRPTLVNEGWTRFTQSCSKSSTIIANYFSFYFLTSFTVNLVKGGIFFPKFICYLLLFSNYCIIINSLWALANYFFDIWIYYMIDRPSKHLFDWMHHLTVWAFIEQFLWCLAIRFLSLKLHQLLLHFQRHCK